MTEARHQLYKACAGRGGQRPANLSQVVEMQVRPIGIGKLPVEVAFAGLAARLDGLGEPAAEIIVQAC